MSLSTIDTEQKKKRLLLLGGGFEQLYALRIAKELGAEVIVFDGHTDAACSYEADEFYQVNIKNSDELIAKAKEANIDAVFVHAAELAVEAAMVAQYFGLPGLPVDIALRGTEKSERSACLMEAGIRVPEFAAIESSADWDAWSRAAETIKFPMMAKPTRLAGARGVQYVESMEELRTYYEARTEFGGQSFQLEEYVQGLQLSTESVVFKGLLEVTSIALRHYDTTANLWPFQIEDGHSMPWSAADETRASLVELIDQCRNAIGIEDGVLKGDIIITNSGEMVVLEMAVRTSGGRFCDTVVPLSSCVNILYPLLQHALDMNVDLNHLKPTRNVGVSQRFVLIPPGTKLKRMKQIQSLVIDPSVVGYWFREDIHTLDKAPQIRCHGDRLGYVICTSETQAEADALARAKVEQIAAALIAEDGR